MFSHASHQKSPKAPKRVAKLVASDFPEEKVAHSSSSSLYSVVTTSLPFLCLLHLFIRSESRSSCGVSEPKTLPVGSRQLWMSDIPRVWSLSDRDCLCEVKRVQRRRRPAKHPALKSRHPVPRSLPCRWNGWKTRSTSEPRAWWNGRATTTSSSPRPVCRTRGTIPASPATSWPRDAAPPPPWWSTVSRRTSASALYL